jgi:hypothetical protein
MPLQAALTVDPEMVKRARIAPEKTSFLRGRTISLTVRGEILRGEHSYATLDSFIPEWPKEIDLIEEEFNKQKKAFLKRAAEEPLFLTPYLGKFVACCDGNIVDNDSDVIALTDRFFTRYGDVPVYIGKIGRKRKVFIDSPALR